MRKWIVGVVLILSAAPASAQTIDGQTKCAAVSAIFDAPQPNLPKVRAFTDYVLSAFSILDQKHAAKGGPQIIALMSPEGRSKAVAAVPLWCDDHPDETLQQSAADVYDALKGVAAPPGDSKSKAEKDGRS